MITHNEQSYHVSMMMKTMTTLIIIIMMMMHSLWRGPAQTMDGEEMQILISLIPVLNTDYMWD